MQTHTLHDGLMTFFILALMSISIPQTSLNRHTIITASSTQPTKLGIDSEYIETKGCEN